LTDTFTQTVLRSQLSSCSRAADQTSRNLRFCCICGASTMRCWPKPQQPRRNLAGLLQVDQSRRPEAATGPKCPIYLDTMEWVKIASASKSPSRFLLVPAFSEENHFPRRADRVVEAIGFTLRRKGTVPLHRAAPDGFGGVALSYYIVIWCTQLQHWGKHFGAQSRL